MKEPLSSFSDEENHNGSGFTLPTEAEAKKAVATFSIPQKVLILILMLIGFGAMITAGLIANSKFKVEVPVAGGEIKEGLIGTPRFINPLFAVTDTDRDLTALIYSGLMRIGEDGELIPDLAESYSISENGLEYTFNLRENLKFHDGRPLTAEDVVFTIEKIKEGSIGSVKAPQFSNIQATALNEGQVLITLAEPSASLEHLTVGILPRHLWKVVPADAFSFDDLNSEPVGSGPYKISKVTTDRTGVPTSYTLTAFKDFALGRPSIEKLILNFYSNEDDLIKAYENGEIDNMGAISPKSLKNLSDQNQNLISSPLSRIFGVFFNHNQAGIFTHSEVRQALDLAAPKQKIVDTVLFGQGIISDNPFPAQIESASEDQAKDLEEASELLKTNGWELNSNGIWENDGEELRFTLTTASTPELQETAIIIAQAWNEFGARVETEYLEISRLNQTVIRPRKYEALLFGLVNGRNPDPYAFWHSSQRLDPGLNVSLYTSITTDKLLSDLRKTDDVEEKQNLLNQISEEITEETPAIFLYAPNFIYLIDKDIKNVNIPLIGNTAERFSNIHSWYLKTDYIWKIFTNNK